MTDQTGAYTPAVEPDEEDEVRMRAADARPAVSILDDIVRELAVERSRRLNELFEKGCGFCGEPAIQVEVFTDPSTLEEVVRFRCTKHSLGGGQ